MDMRSFLVHGRPQPRQAPQRFFEIEAGKSLHDLRSAALVLAIPEQFDKFVSDALRFGIALVQQAGQDLDPIDGRSGVEAHGIPPSHRLHSALFDQNLQERSFHRTHQGPEPPDIGGGLVALRFE
jgi:hypothetical protein